MHHTEHFMLSNNSSKFQHRNIMLKTKKMSLCISKSNILMLPFIHTRKLENWLNQGNQVTNENLAKL